MMGALLLRSLVGGPILLTEEVNLCYTFKSVCEGWEPDFSLKEETVKCVICKQGETAPGKVTVTLERDEMTLVVKGVPASVCENCGEEYLSEDVSARLLSLAEDVARSGVQVDIRRYIAA